jgi:hypothetical protein
VALISFSHASSSWNPDVRSRSRSHTIDIVVLGPIFFSVVWQSRDAKWGFITDHAVGSRTFILRCFWSRAIVEFDIHGIVARSVAGIIAELSADVILTVDDFGDVPAGNSSDVDWRNSISARQQTAAIAA